jgi:hypothetical protein
VDQREHARVQLGERLELVAGALPLSQDAQKLEEKDPEFRVRRLAANLGLECAERRLRVPLPQELLGP